MIMRISRKAARKNSSQIFRRNDRMAIAQIYSWKHATKLIVRKQRKATNCDIALLMILQEYVRAIDCDNFAQSLRKQFLNNSIARTMFSEWRVHFVQHARETCGMSPMCLLCESLPHSVLGR